MHNDKYTNITIALAGIFQACALIKQLAWTGKCDVESFTTSIYSLLQTNPQSVIEVYQDISKLSLGLKTMINFFNNNLYYKDQKDTEIVRYFISLLYLEKKLLNRPDLINIIKNGISRAKTQADLFSINHDIIMANLAGIYIDTLSTFTFRIHIIGLQSYLNNPHIANKTRALLLAGIRSAVLWRQTGGSKLQLFFKKSLFLKCADQLYKSSLTFQQI